MQCFPPTCCHQNAVSTKFPPPPSPTRTSPRRTPPRVVGGGDVQQGSNWHTDDMIAPHKSHLVSPSRRLSLSPSFLPFGDGGDDAPLPCEGIKFTELTQRRRLSESGSRCSGIMMGLASPARRRRSSFTSMSLTSIAAHSPIKRRGTQQFGAIVRESPLRHQVGAVPAALTAFPGRLSQVDRGDFLQSFDLDGGTHRVPIHPATSGFTKDFSDDDDDAGAFQCEQQPAPPVDIRIGSPNDTSEDDDDDDDYIPAPLLSIALPPTTRSMGAGGLSSGESSTFMSPTPPLRSPLAASLSLSNRKHRASSSFSPHRSFASANSMTMPQQIVVSNDTTRTPQQQRAIEQHRQRQAEHYEKLDASHARRALAQERREFHLDQRNLQLMATWAAMAMLAFRTRKFIQQSGKIIAEKAKISRRGGQYVFPIVMVALRRGLRRIRTRHLLASQHYEKPTLSTLNSDKILGLFSDAVLRSAAHSMKIRYVFPNEAIIFIGCEDDEAFVLASGSADVMMGATKVFTIQPGMVFGTIGMISGEPRSASIFARGEGVMVWVMKRAVFDAAGDSPAVSAAHDALAELRQKNIMNVYKPRLTPAALGAFPLLRGLPDAALAGLLVGATSLVARRGAVLSDPNQPMSAVSHFLLLKGRVMLVHQAPRHRFTNQEDDPYDAIGELRNTIDVPPQLLVPPLSTLFTSKKTAKTNAAEAASKHFVNAPALINVNSLFLPGGMLQPTPFVITAMCDCDFLCFSRRTLRAQDAEELAPFQRNALNAHADFLGAPTKREVATMLLDSIAPLFSVMPSAQAVFATLRASIAADSLLGPMEIEKWVYPRGGQMCFDRDNEFTIHIELQVTQGGLSLWPVWPPLAEVLFASRDNSTQVAKRTACLRVRRSDVLAWFCRALPDTQDLRTVCTVLANNLVSLRRAAAARIASFATFGLDVLDVSVLLSGNVATSSPTQRLRGGSIFPPTPPPSSATSPRKVSVAATSTAQTVQNVLGPIMDGVLLNLKSNMPNIMRSNPHRTTSPRTTTSPIAHPVRSRSPRTVSPVTTPSTRNPENIQPSYGNITKLAPIDPECSNVSVVVVVSPPPHSPPFPRPDGSAAAPRSSVRPRTPSRSCSPQQAPQGDAEFLPLREAQSLDSVCSRRSTTSITTTATVSPKKKSPSRSAQHKEECGNNGFVSLDVMKTLISTTHLHNGGGGKVVTGRSRSSSARKDRCPDVFDLPATHHRDDHLHRPVHHHVSLDVLRGKHKPQDARGR